MGNIPGSKRGKYILHTVNHSWFKKGQKPWSFEKTRPITITKPCEYCGKDFTVSRNPRWSNPFPKCCSKECRYNLCKTHNTRIHRQCIVCKKEFEIPVAWVKKREVAGLYCSIKCKKSRSIRYPESVKKNARLLIHCLLAQGTLKRLSCEICGDENTDAHHYKGYKPQNWLDIKWLCRNCHKREHARLRHSGESLTM